MTTIAELLALEHEGVLEAEDAYAALDAFMARFDPALAEAMEGCLCHEDPLMARVRAEVLLSGTDDGSPQRLVRLCFDGQPLGLLRFDGCRSWASDLRWTVRMTDRRASSRLADALVQALGGGIERLQESAAHDEAGALLDFGVSSVLDLEARSLSFLACERLFLLAHETPLAVLSRMEDGRFMVGRRRGGEDAFETLSDGEAAFDALGAELERVLPGPVGHHPLLLHGPQDRRAVGLVADRAGELVCSTIEEEVKGLVEQARGDGARARFAELARQMLEDVLKPAIARGVPRSA